MTTTRSKPVKARPPRALRSFGYGVAVAANVLLLVIVNNLEEWDVVSWLTDDFSKVVGIISFSLWATIVANAVFIAYDPKWFKAALQAVLNAISVVVMIRIYQVFPFDFDRYDFDWGMLVRIILIIGIVGTTVATVVEVGKVIRYGLTEANR